MLKVESASVSLGSLAAGARDRVDSDLAPMFDRLEPV